MTDISELAKTVTARSTTGRTGGRRGRLAERTQAPIVSLPTIKRKIPVYEVLDEDGVELIHNASMEILEEVGIDFRDDDAAAIWAEAGADVDGHRVRIGRDMLMELISTAPEQYTMHARNRERTVEVGRENSIFVPSYGSPYVLDFDNERRYGTLEDLYNFHRLAYMSPSLHSSGCITVEPVDIPVPERHLDIMYGLLRYSDKPFMGVVTSGERAQDSVDMAKIVFGEEFMRDNTVMTSVISCNSPLVWDETMLDALKVYTLNNQACLLSPFVLAGASTSASTVGAVAQLNAEALAGIAFTQILNPGCPMVYGQYMVTVNMKTGAPMGGTPEVCHMQYMIGQLARRYKLPWRTSGMAVGSKLADAQAGYEANMMMHASLLAGANYIWHVAGWLEAGLTVGYSKFMLDAEQLEGFYHYAQGVDLDDLKEAMAAVREVGPGGHFLGTQHTLDNFESAFFMPNIMDFNSFEQWSAEGAKDAHTRGLEKAQSMLAAYEEPKLDEGVHEALLAFMARRREELPDSLT